MSLHEIESAARRILEDHRLAPGDRLDTSGKLVRCGTTDKPRGKDGAYIVHADDPTSLWWKDWRTGEEGTASLAEHRTLTAEERVKRDRIMRERKAARDRELAATRGEAARKAARFAGGQAAPDDNPYLHRKGVRAVPGLVEIGKDGQRILVVPAALVEGEIRTAQFIRPDGEKRFLSGGEKRGTSFRIRRARGCDAEMLYLAEGIATALSIHEATGGAEVLSCFDAGNLVEVAVAVRQAEPERQIVVCADDDHGTEAKTRRNPGMENATEAARRIGAKLAVPPRNLLGDGTDFNDLHMRYGLDAVFEAVTSGRDVPAEKLQSTEKQSGRSGRSGECTDDAGFHLPDHGLDRSGMSGGCPPSFILRTEGERPGLYYLEVKERDGQAETEEIWLGPPLHVLGMTRDGQSSAWGLLLEWRDPDGQVHQWAMPRSELVKDRAPWLSELAYGGWSCAPGTKARNLIALYLSTYRTAARVRCVPRTGWHGGVFVLPDAVFGQQGERTVMQGGPSEHTFRLGGTFEDWQKTVAAWAVGNSRLTLAVCAALAAPLMELCGAESGGFNFVGASSTGKSTALLAAGSVWGGGGIGGYLRNWRATSNGLEGVAALHCDCLLALDEIGQATGRTVEEAAYMLGNGVGKSRASADGSARAAREWRCMVLSTGEVGLAARIAEEGHRVRVGQEVRLVDVPADAGRGLGLFEELHGHADARALADAVRAASGEHYGHAARAFLQKLVERKWEEAAGIRKAVETFARNLCPQGADGQVRRVAKRFALCAVAGEMAREYGVLPWPEDEGIRAATVCFKAWLDSRGGAGASEDAAIISTVRLFIEQHGASRFQALESEPADRCINRVGFRRESVAGAEYLCLPEAFKSEVVRGHDPKRAARVLAEAGMLRRGDGNNLTVKADLPGLGRPRCYAIRLPGDTEAA